MTTLNNFKDCSGSRVIISAPAALSVIGRFLQCPPLIGCRKNPRKFASGMIFQDHRRVPVSIFMVKIAASEPLRELLEALLKLISNFI
jgi:hypothetical protein